MTTTHDNGTADQAPTATRQDVLARGRFRALVAGNPNYFGTFPDLGFDEVEAKAGDTTFEGVSCVAYDQRRDRLQATIAVTQATGYRGSLCEQGSLEYLRFYVDYGSGWADAGLATVSVHDVPEGKDCSGAATLPLSYVAGVAHAPHRDYCRRPVLPRVRVILSWDLEPPAGQPDWRPVWGESHDCTVQITPRSAVLGDVVGSLPDKVLAQIPEKLQHQLPLPQPDPEPGPPLALADLATSYAGLDVPQHRFALPHLTFQSQTTGLAPASMIGAAVAAKEAGIDWSAVLGAVEKTSGDTTYEQLECLGLDEGLSALVATFNVKRASGYSGGPCTAGSTEYVAFWADWDDDCRLTYLGTVPVTVHDYDVPDGGLCYAAVLPVDLGSLRRSCERPLLPQVRAVLSWGGAPSTTDPDQVPVWGNWIERHVQVAPGRPYDGTARFVVVGGVAAPDVDLVTGLTRPGARLGQSLATLDPRGCPFAGQVVLQGAPDPALAGRSYRIRATNVDSGGTEYLTSPFVVYTSALPGSTVVTPDPMTGWTSWRGWQDDTTGVLGVHRPGGDDRWDYVLELDTAGHGVSTARVQMDNTVPRPPADGDPVNVADLRLDTMGACRVPPGPLTGTLVARDRHFAGWSIALLGGNGTTNLNVPLSHPLPVDQETPLAGEPFTLDLTGLPSCGYVVRLSVDDRAIVDSVRQGHGTTVDRGLCLD